MDYLDNYLAKFPYYMRKNKGSANYKHHSIVGNQLQEIYSTLSMLKNNKELIKPIEMYKFQSANYSCTIYFNINVPIQTISFKKDGKSVKAYSTGENTFILIIDDPDHKIPKFRVSCEVITPTGEKYAHGIPENDEIEHNMYDHDQSLDQIGNLLGIARQEYKQVEPSDYFDTYPLFNNENYEPDYYYAKRLRDFCENFHKKPLPLLYLQAFLHVEGKLINREKKLCKMAPGTMYGDLPVLDNPLSFEHRDLIDNTIDIDDYLFTYDVNTYSPLLKTLLHFEFEFHDTLWNKKSMSGVIVPYLDNKNSKAYIIKSTKSWDIIAKSLIEKNTGIRFKYFPTRSAASAELDENKNRFVESGLYSEEYTFSLMNYDNANIYVSVNGSDKTGDGSINAPYRTINYATQRALNNDLIFITQGRYDENEILITNNINIVGSIAPTVTTRKNIYFTIIPDKSLLIDNIKFENGKETSILNNINIINEGNTQVNFVKPLVNKELPNTYQKVEWIESTGTQYIKTGECIQQHTKIDAQFQATSTDKLSVLFGAAAQRSEEAIIYWVADKDGEQSYNYNNHIVKIGKSDKKQHTIKTEYNKVIVDKKEYNTGAERRFILNKSEIYLFGLNYGNEKRNSKVKLTSFKIYKKLYDNSILQRDFVPCYRKTDKVIGLYDMVYNKFYMNSGTGTFNKGANV